MLESGHETALAVFRQEYLGFNRPLHNYDVMRTVKAGTKTWKRECFCA